MSYSTIKIIWKDIAGVASNALSNTSLFVNVNELLSNNIDYRLNFSSNCNSYKNQTQVTTNAAAMPPLPQKK